jgi:hypothetical protein
MYIIDLMLKSSPVTLSVHRKELETAQSLYQELLDALKSGNTSVLELTCEQQTEKKISVLMQEVCAVQMYEKSGNVAGRTPGFFAMGTAEKS